ncbi:MAG: hypothetical protein N3A01_03805 [Bacteroidales bacterium]|nr:hypothetical protein [Bacteroidales bacterium]
MKFRKFYLLVLIVSFNYTYSQSKKFKYYYENSHSIFCEAGFFFSNYYGPHSTINYDGIVKTFQHLIVSLRGGIGFSFAKQKDSLIMHNVIIPTAFHFQLTRVNTQVGGMKRYNVRAMDRLTRFKNLDIGFGWYNFITRKFLSPFLFIGIRHQRPDGGINFKIGFLSSLDIVHNRNAFKTLFFSPIFSLGKTF